MIARDPAGSYARSPPRRSSWGRMTSRACCRVSSSRRSPTTRSSSGSPVATRSSARSSMRPSLSGAKRGWSSKAIEFEGLCRHAVCRRVERSSTRAPIGGRDVQVQSQRGQQRGGAPHRQQVAGDLFYARLRRDHERVVLLARLAGRHHDGVRQHVPSHRGQHLDNKGSEKLRTSRCRRSAPTRSKNTWRRTSAFPIRAFRPRATARPIPSRPMTPRRVVRRIAAPTSKSS